MSIRPAGHLRQTSGPGRLPTSWVKYILTTANTWKTPIKNFELFLEYGNGDFISLCWDGPITRSGPSTFSARSKDFIPARELTVYFFHPSFGAGVQSAK